MIIFNIAKMIARFILLFIFRIKVYGKENMPKDSSVIVAINHTSNWDPVVATIASPRRFSFMAKAELFKFKPFGKLLSSIGAFPVNRGKGDISSIKTALTILRSGEVMAIFPEGTRVRNNQSVTPKPGAVMLATRAKVPIVPMRIEGKYRWMSKINIYIGKPITYEEYFDQKLMVDTLQDLSNSLMSTIKGLNSENYIK